MSVQIVGDRNRVLNQSKATDNFLTSKPRLNWLFESVVSSGIRKRIFEIHASGFEIPLLLQRRLVVCYKTLCHPKFQKITSIGTLHTFYTTIQHNKLSSFEIFVYVYVSITIMGKIDMNLGAWGLHFCCGLKFFASAIHAVSPLIALAKCADDVWMKKRRTRTISYRYNSKSVEKTRRETG